jgi:hypothetical protein
MTHAEDEIRVIQECHRRTLEVRSRPRAPAWQKYLNAELDELLDHGPRYSSVDWFDAHTEAARVRMIRAVARLAAAGLVVRVTTGNRLTHLHLTDAGERLAEDLKANPGSAEYAIHRAKLAIASRERMSQGREIPPLPPIEPDPAHTGTSS